MDILGLTHKDLAKALGVSETTIKSYRRKFPACILVASKGKPLRFAPEAETVCRRIQELFALGMAVEDVRLRLAEEFAWIEPVLASESMLPSAEDTEVADTTSAKALPAEDKKALLDEAALLKEALRHSEPQVISPVIPDNSKVTHTSCETVEPVKSAKSGESVEPSEPVAKAVPVVSQTTPETGRTTPYTTLPPEVRTAISDMARTVVELTLHQKKLLKQVERLEARLDAALETLANGAHEQGPEVAAPQSVCAKTPIHEQIQSYKATPNNTNEVQTSESKPLEQKNTEPEPTKTKNPLLKIFGLERHG